METKTKLSLIMAMKPVRTVKVLIILTLLNPIVKLRASSFLETIQLFFEVPMSSMLFIIIRAF